MDKIFVGLGVLACVLFLVFAMIVYNAKLKSDSLAKELVIEKDNIVFLKMSLSKSENRNTNYRFSINAKLSKMKEQIILLEESIDPKNFRWAKIKKIREVIKETVAYHKFINVKDLTRYASAVVDYSEKYDVPVSLVLAVTRQESAYNPKAVSHAGAQGLMQLMPATAKECADDIGKRYFNVFKIRDNVQLGVWYLSKMLYVFNEDVSLAVRAYNAGPVYVKKVVSGEWMKYPNETVDYHEKVIKYRDNFINLGL